MATDPTDPTTRLSILHIVLEDFSTLGSSVFASPHSTATPSTPNLARLAARGTIFQRAFCQAPICNPSRTSFMTSRRPGTTRVLTNDDEYHASVPPGLPTLVDFLRASDPAASVACASGSKLFHIACDHDAMGLDVSQDSPPPIASLPQPLRNAARFILQPDAPHSADRNRALTALARLLTYRTHRRRFYLGVGFVETHAFNEQVCHLEILPPWTRRHSPTAPPSRGRERLPPLITWPNFDFWRSRTDAEQRRAIGDYYLCASHVDGTVGALVGSLDALNLSRTTAVVVQGDHGYSLGLHGRWSKYSLFEDATRVPLLIVVPGGVRGRAVDDVVESLDVVPTLLDLWGVPSQPAVTPQGADRSVTTTSRYTTSPSSSYWLARSDDRSAAVTGGLESVQGQYVQLDGLALTQYLTVGAATSSGRMHIGAPAPSARARRRRYARSELHLPCGLGCCMLNSPYDGLPPGYTRTPRVGPVVQLYIRTRRWAYTAVLRGTLRPDHTAPIGGAKSAPPAAPLQLIDELLFDHRADPTESDNLAYYAPQRPMVHSMRAAALRDWSVPLSASPPPNSSRARRAEWLRELTGYRRNWWKR